MNINVTRYQRSDWGWVLLSLIVFLLFLYFGFIYIFLVPYPGLAYTTNSAGWVITDSQHPNVDSGDVVVRIGDLAFSAYRQDWSRTPFLEYQPGDSVPILKSGEDDSEQILMPQPSLADRFERVINMSVWFLPFWVVGTITVLFLRPRDNRWRLLVLVMYFVAIWVTSAPLATWQLYGSRLVYGLASYMLGAVVVHLHLVAPEQIEDKWTPRAIKGMYGLLAIVVVLGLFGLPSQRFPTDVVAIGLLISLFLLIWRLARTGSNTAEKTAVRLMVAGIAFGFGPGIIVQMLGNAIILSDSLGYAIALLSLPALPIFYLYAIYKRQLGGLELRANRLLSIYSFLLLYPPSFLVLVLLGEQIFDSASARRAFLLFVSTLFVILMPPLLARYQQWINKLAYGASHNPNELLRVFASRIPNTRRRPDLAALLAQEILPSLLIRQSALIVTDEATPDVMYAQGWSTDKLATAVLQLPSLLKSAERYRPPFGTEVLPWVRLALPLSTGNQEIGVWLFGSRDPDDFYTAADVELLQTLANQIAPIIENIVLYENLEAQVVRRTAELKAERDRTQAILDSAGEGIFFTDTVGRLMYSNTIMARLTGYELDDYDNRPLISWIHEDPTAVDAISEAIQQQKGWSGETVWQRENGQTLNVNLTLAPLQQTTQEVSGFVGVMSDITRLKEVDRLKSNIISNVSHELKTPLSNILLYISLIETSPLAEHGRFLDVIRHETKRLSQLIQDLLDLSKLDSSTAATPLAPVEVHDIVEHLMVVTKPRFEETGLTPVVDICADLPPVLADPGQIEQVLVNLIQNAFSYVPAPGTITLSACSDLFNGHQAVQIRVADNGPGIPAHELPQIFDRFFRGERSRREAIAGTGLGLAICKEIVDRHHGRIEVQSQEGHGTAFIVWLRAATPDEELQVSLHK